MPNGGRRRASCSTFLKLMKMPCAVSGRRYASEAESSSGPTCVSNMRLNWRGSVRSHSENSPGCTLGLRPHCESSSLSARKRSLQVRQATSGSLKPSTMPDGLPAARVRDPRGVDRDDVVALEDHCLDPARLDVVLEEHAVMTVVVGRPEAAVDLRRREDEAAPPCQRHDLVHRHGLHRHV